MSHEENAHYEFAVHHSEEEGKKIRKRIWLFFWVLLAITTVEVGIGMKWKEMFADNPAGIWPVIKWGFIGLTLLKAFFIVMEYMHLGGERKNLRWTILGSYLVLVAYLVFMVLLEATKTYNFELGL